MSTAALSAGWGQFRSGPAPGPSAPGLSSGGTPSSSTSSLPAFGAAGAYRAPGSNGTSASIAVPSGVASGHVVLVDLYIESTATVTPPSGFTEIPTAPSTMPSGQVHRQFWKRASGADAGSYVFTWTGSCYYEGVAVRYTGVVASGTPYDAGAGAPDTAADSSGDDNSPAVELITQGANRLLVWSGSNFDGYESWTPPSGYTERADGGCLAVATRNAATATSTGAVSGTYGTSDKATGRLLALLPTASPPTVAAGADATTQVDAVFARTATDSDNGATITAREWMIASDPGTGTVRASTATLSWTPTTAGTYTLRYTATNSAGNTSDEITVTVTAEPAVTAGADVTLAYGDTLSRTATEDDNGFAISGRAWTVESGPDQVGDTLASAAALSWTPTVPGTYVLRYTATNSQGPAFDEVTVLVAVQVLRNAFAAAYLQVQAAFGADLAADPDGWDWHDITHHVRQSDGATVSITMGRADEAGAAQPSRCSVLLDNRSGDYGLGGTSQWWPYVRRNTPIRVRLDPNTGTYVSLFQGHAVGWTPGWDLTGTDAIVVLEASGTLRRLNQSQTSVPSTYRTILEHDIAAGKVVAYWPMTETTAQAGTLSRFGEVVTGRTRHGMEWLLYPDREDHKPPELAADQSFGASEPLPTLNAAELYADVPRYTSTGQGAVRMLIRFPDSGAVPGQEILALEVSGSSDNVTVVYGPTAGSLSVQADDGSDENTEFALAVDGGAFVLQLEMVESGGTVSYALTLVPVDEGPEPTATVSTGSWSGSIGRISQVWINTHPDDEDDGIDPAEIIAPGAQNWVVGHVAVYSTITEDYHLDELTGWDGEQAVARIQRLADEAGVSVTVVDADDPDNPRPQESDLMGPQFAGELLPLLESAAAVDGGVLYDGHDFGLTYTTRRYRYSRDPADLTIDVAESQLLEPFDPVDDDQGITNRVVVSRDGGADQLAEDVDGPLGTATIGFYDQSATLPLYSDDAALAHAQWRLHLGTAGAFTYRYPTVAFHLAKNPELAEDWLATQIGGRIDVVNLLDARTQLPGDTQSLLLQGYTETINQHQWRVIANTTPYEPYRVATVAADTDDDGDHVGRADTEGCELAAAAAAGASTLSVTTTAGPRWTTAAAQYPMVLDVGGIPVTATACADTGPTLGAWTDQTGVSFTDSDGLTGTYHVYADDTPASGAGLVVHLHGDGAYEYLNPTDEYSLGGHRGLPDVARAKGYILAVPLSPDTTGTVTWWEAGARNAQWLAELIQQLTATYDVDTSRIWLVGYSGGAVQINSYFVPAYGNTLLSGGGGALIIGGGGSIVGTPTFSAELKANFPMHWWTGDLDNGDFVSDGYDALTDAQEGSALYAAEGFTTTLTTPPGIGHELDGAFGALLDDVLSALPGFEPADDTPGDVRPNLVASYLDVDTGTTTTSTTSFTPSDGEVIVVKGWGGDLNDPNFATCTGGNLTFGLHRHIQATGHSEIFIFVAEVGTSPGSMSVSVTWQTGSNDHGIIVERWADAQIAGTPAGASPYLGTDSLPSATVAATDELSVITWLCADWDVTAGAQTYVAPAVQTQTSSTSNVRVYGAYQPVSAAGDVTVGMSAPAGQTWTLAAVELLPAATSTADTGTLQEFTVTGATMPAAKPAGTPVSVWQPPVLGL